MHLDGLDLNLLVALNVLLEEKSVSRAADKLFISQPAMSLALQRLRDRFSDQLLVRTGQRMELTTRAQALEGPVREIINLSRAILDANRAFDPALLRRTFTIMMTDEPIAVMMPALLKRIGKEAPGVELIIEPIITVADRQLDTGNVDLAIRTERGLLDPKHLSQSLRKAPLFSDTWVCVVSGDNPGIGETLTLEDYFSNAHLTISLGDGVLPLNRLALGDRINDLSIAATAVHFSDLLFMLPGTRLIATVPARLANKMASMASFRIFDVPFELPVLQEILYWHERNETDVGHMWLRKIFIEVGAGIGNQ